MATKNPRLNVTFDNKTAAILGSLAKKQEQSTSGLIKMLVLEALEMHEDLGLSALAKKRDAESSKTISHEKAWD